MKLQHTPEPWEPRIYGGWDAPRVWSNSGSIAILQHRESGPAEAEANTHPMAAAPDLLEFAMRVCYGEGDGIRPLIAQGKAAIQKATGAA